MALKIAKDRVIDPEKRDETRRDAFEKYFPAFLDKIKPEDSELNGEEATRYILDNCFEQIRDQLIYDMDASQDCMYFCNDPEIEELLETVKKLALPETAGPVM